MRNLRQVHVIPVVISTHRRTERQLARMLLLQVSIYIVLNLPISVTYLISFLPVDFKTTSQFYLMYTITQTLTYTFNSASFITYILSTRSYRQECIRIVKKILRIEDHGNHRMGPTEKNQRKKRSPPRYSDQRLSTVFLERESQTVY